MKIIAHRGDSANLPENTPEGWAAGYRDGAHVVEADIRLSKDGSCICAHDPDLRRLFARSERPEDLPLDELLRLGNAEGGRIVLLADLLQFAREDRAVLLDLKDESPFSLDAIWQAITKAVPTPQRQRVIAGCHTLEAVRFFAAQRETCILGFIPAPEQAEAFLGAGAHLIRLWERDVTTERVANLHALGAQVWVTVGGHGTAFPAGDTTPRALAELAKAGIDGVLVNDIAMTKNTLETER